MTLDKLAIGKGLETFALTITRNKIKIYQQKKPYSVCPLQEFKETGVPRQKTAQTGGKFK